jgi:hypothetical protein
MTFEARIDGPNKAVGDTVHAVERAGVEFAVDVKLHGALG